MAYPLSEYTSFLRYINNNIKPDITQDHLELVIQSLRSRDGRFDPRTLSSYDNYIGLVGYSIIHQLARCGNASLISHSIRKYGNQLLEIEDNGQRPLQSAVECKHVEVVRTLLDLRAEVNATNTYKDPDLQCTALWYAAEKTGNIPIVKLLVQRGGKAKAPLSDAGERILRIAESDLRKPFIEALCEDRILKLLPTDIIDLIVNYIPIEELPNKKIILNFVWKGASIKRGKENLDVSSVEFFGTALKTIIRVRIPKNLGPKDIRALPFSCSKIGEKEVQVGKSKYKPTLSQSFPRKLLLSVDDVRNLTLKANIFKGDRLTARSEIGLRVPDKMEEGQTYSLVVTSDNFALSAALIKRQPTKINLSTASKTDQVDRQRQDTISCHRLAALQPEEVELEDGSRWGITPEHCYLTRTWKMNDLLSITGSLQAQDLHIVNKTRHSYVRAYLVDHPFPFGSNSHWISGIDLNQGVIVLRNQTRWCVDPQNFYILTSRNWIEYDRIIVILNSDKALPYNLLLLNISNTSRVRVKEAEGR